MRIWPEDAIPMLHDSFHRTTWDVFKGEGTFTRESLDEYTTNNLYYMNFCVDSVTSWKQVHVASNRNPWMTHNVQQLIRPRNVAYRSGDTNIYSFS